MALPKKGSRNIVIEGVGYRWRVRKKPSYSQGIEEKGLLLAVEDATHAGSTLVVELPQTHPSSWITVEAVPVTPSDVERLVRLALRLGWRPTQPGTTFTVSTNELQRELGTPLYQAKEV